SKPATGTEKFPQFSAMPRRVRRCMVRGSSERAPGHVFKHPYQARLKRSRSETHAPTERCFGLRASMLPNARLSVGFHRDPTAAIDGHGDGAEQIEHLMFDCPGAAGGEGKYFTGMGYGQG